MELNIEDLAGDYQNGGKFAKRPTRPTDYQDKKTDDRDWYKRTCNWLFWMYANDYTGIPYTERAEMLNNRLYAQGRQPNDKYMKQFCKFDKQKNRWKNWLNISFDIFAIIPKFRAWILGSFDKVDYNISASCVDEGAGAEREMLVYQKIYAQDEKDFYDAAHFMLGQDNPDAQEQLPFTPTNGDQMKMLMDMGFIKLISEQKIEELLKQSEDDSKWKARIKRKLFEDAFDLGRIWTKGFIDPVSKKIKVRYVDPAAFIVRSRNRDNYYEDINHAGEIVPYTVGDLRAYGIKDEELKKAIKKYSNKSGNIAYNVGEVWSDLFNDCTVYVLDCEFESFDFEKWEFRETDAGMTPFRVKLDADTKRENKTISYPKWHRCKWVIGTDIIFDYGYQFDVPYNQEERPQSSYTGAKIADRAPVSLIISDADDIQNAILKLRAAIAKSRPSGVVMDFNVINAIGQGGEKMGFRDIVSAFQQTGDMLIKNPTTPQGQAIPGVPAPIIELKGGYGTALSEGIASVQFFINNMREKIGVGAITDGSEGQTDAVGIAQIAEQGTSNVLRNMLMGYQYVKQETFDKMAYRYEIRAKSDMLQNYEGIVGVESIDFMKFFSKRHHGVNITALVDEDMKKDVQNKAEISLNASKTGGMGIEMSDYFVITRLLNQGLLKSAEIYLSWKEQQQKAQAEKMQQQNMQLNGQNMKEQESLKMQAMIAGISEQLKADMALQQEKNTGAQQLAAQNNEAHLKELVTKIVMETQKELKVQEEAPTPTVSKT